MTRLDARAIRVLVACVVAASSATPVLAQPTTAPADVEGARFRVGLWGLIGVPRGAFADNIGTNGGLGGDFEYRLGDGPVRVGFAVGGLFQDRATRLLPFSLTIRDVLVDVTTSAHMVLTHGRVRVQPVTGRVRPYVEGLFGFSYLFTQTAIDLGRDFDPRFDPVGPSTTHLDDFALSAGGGTGVAIELHTWSDGRLNLDIGTRLLYGGEAEYLVGGPEGFESGLEGLEFRRSRTDLVQVQIGISVDF